ncbi:hypothetical protein [Streptomyces sp. NPDC050263]|uniref:hypothetical protein n=1 Tax=Streptomyces sp. NPDC050263 TaxID=3155037 RepID=UPI00343A50FA
MSSPRASESPAHDGRPGAESVYVGDRVVVLSPGPGSRIVLDVPVELPDERDQLTTRGLPEFTALRTKIGQVVRGTR